MLMIRLRRVGRRHIPSYRIVVTEKTAPVKGKYIEMLGYYNPQQKQLEVNSEKVFEWLKKGALPSNTVARLLISKGLKDKKIVYTPEKPRPKKAPKSPKSEVVAGVPVAESDLGKKKVESPAPEPAPEQESQPSEIQEEQAEKTEEKEEISAKGESALG